MSEVQELERFAAHDQHLANRLFGQQNAHLKQIEQSLSVRLTSRGSEVLIEGEPLAAALTRLGFGSRAVITGDVTQIDLPTSRLSGLIQAQKVLAGVKGISFNTFTDRDVVRHPIVQAIVQAYDRAAMTPES